MDSLYKINDRVIHRREGLSNIVSFAEVSGQKYFLLHALRGDGEMLYVPVSRCEAIIRNIMTDKEATTLLKYMKDISLEINANTKQRRDAYKRMLNTGEVKDIAYLASQLHCYKKSEEYQGKLGVMDIEMLQKAHDMLMDEFAIIFNKDRDKIEEFISKRIG